MIKNSSFSKQKMRNKVIAIVGRGPGKGLAALTVQEKLQGQIFSAKGSLAEWCKDLHSHRENNPITVLYEYPQDFSIRYLPKNAITIEIISPGRAPNWVTDYTIENDMTADFFVQFEILVKEAIEEAKLVPTMV